MMTFKKMREACWSGFKQVGMKKKNGKEVPNCVPKESNEEKDTHKTKDDRTAKKGLWYNINQKKKRGEAPAKKGDPDYPKTLNIEGKESVDEAMSLADIRRKKEREERRKRDHGGETQHQRMMRKVYGNMMGGLKKEEVEVNEAVNYFNVAKAFDDYAKKYGGIDKKDFMKVGAFVRQLGRESDVNKQDKTFMAMKKYISAMDTDPRDGVLQIFQKHGMWKNGRIMREGLEEKAVSKAQQKFFGMVRAKQKGEMDDASPEVAKAAKSMSKKDVKDFAKTKHKGLPVKKESVDLDEAFTPKEIKMAIGVASDKRYAKGNMTGAVNAIEKIKKGLSDHPQVKAVLRRQNESLDEVNKAHNTMFKAAFRKKEAEREKAEREKRLKDKGWVRNDRGGMSKVKESTELTEFSDAQLQQLKKAYADLEKINVTSPTYKKLKAMIARMDKGALEKVARAKIRFVSQIAARELAAKGVKLKAGEYMESVKSFIEARGSNYEVYHKDFSTAVQYARREVEKKGYEIDDDEWFRKVASGPRKPSKGKTNSYNIALTKGGKPTRQRLQMQVDGMDSGKYELNMYVS